MNSFSMDRVLLWLSSLGQAGLPTLLGSPGEARSSGRRGFLVPTHSPWHPLSDASSQGYTHSPHYRIYA